MKGMSSKLWMNVGQVTGGSGSAFETCRSPGDPMRVEWEERERDCGPYRHAGQQGLHLVDT